MLSLSMVADAKILAIGLKISAVGLLKIFSMLLF